jgi:hypothetical protein
MPFFKNISNSGKHFFMIRSISTILVFSMLCSGCGLFTEALWERTEPDEYVRLGFGEISEEEIKERGRRRGRSQIVKLLTQALPFDLPT